MKILQKPGEWYRFLSEIVRRKDETENDYLHRVKQCIIAFHNKYTEKDFHDNSQLIRIYGDFQPINLTGRISEYIEYKYFKLRRKYEELPEEFFFEGDGRFFVEPSRDCSFFKGRTGIISFVGNIEDGRENQRREDLNFIKDLWKEFNYKFK